MERSRATRIEEWDRREVGDGPAGLSKLGDAEFSGAVDAHGVWLFMLNGRIVGTSGGSVDDVGAADPLTAYTAPHPSLPLLFAMQERGGEPQGRYFTDDTALAEVHDTLSSGSFTGYIELSEKVHSGDYYVVYYGGRALFVAFVGTSGRLVTGEEAFERANDEVGIYEINSVDLAVQDPPEPAGEREPSGGEAGTGREVGTGRESGASRKGETEKETTEDPIEGLRDPDPDAARDRIEERERADEETTEESGVDGETAGVDAKPGREDREAGEAGTKADDVGAEPEAGADRSEPTRPDRDEGPGDAQGRTQGSSAGGTEASSREGNGGRRTRSTGGLLGPDRDGVPWDDGRTVPALDPERTAVPTDGADAGTGTNRESDPGWRGDASESTSADHGSEPVSRGHDPESRSGAGASEPGTGRERQADDVTADRVAELEAEIEELRDRIESLGAKRDQLAEERDRTTGKRGENESTDEVESAGEFLAEQTGGEETLTRRKAFSEADVFIRYDSKSRPTLADAHEGDASLEAVRENRQLEIHTRFDASAITVDGESFESFLRDTLAYRFVAWLTGEFLFEIRDSGNEAALRDIYDAIPKIDRAEFDETVTGRGESGEDPGTVFDVVLRNKTGEPLFLVDVDEGRDPTRGRLMSELLDHSRHIAEAGRSVAGVFLITSSFFDADAHETVRDATKSGLLDRDSRASFVKISRNTGYHACLVEARGDGFHLSRPDL